MLPEQRAGGDDGRPHIVVVNRWRERYADYLGYVDHRENAVTYVSTEVGLGSVPAEAAGIALVDATDDPVQVRSAVAGLTGRHGIPHRIVALKEDDLLVAAGLREDLGLPGPYPADLLPFRDKFLMCRAIAAAGLPVPAFASADSPGEVADFTSVSGWPVVLKPRIGSSSAGVRILSGPADLAGLPAFTEPMLVQAFVEHPIHHVDGVFDGTRTSRLRVSRYVNTCLGFREGAFLGSVEVDDPGVVRAVTEAADGYLAALTDGPTPFHLEVFVERTPDGAHCVFLEVGARVGGAEIPFIWRDLHGYDLMRAAFELQLGLAGTAAETAPPTGEVGGWLLIPAPEARPCVITHVTSMLGGRTGPYAESILPPGEVLPEADAYYEHVGGRFRFRGRTSGEVEAALTDTAARFRVTAEPVARTVAERPARAEYAAHAEARR
ncbi:ATP-grasp domain-containing protein [Streptomyces griseus]|uniref:ATP-grasp domain-containing protein n=1 Tax=Streptomyces griseus TaxID=1911 RepID=UPI0008401587|nr:biotin carboxylase [Streptomyces griseus]